jgi:NADH dehydrogenase FAD-containing subunit
LLSRFPDKTRRLALESLASRGIEVIEGTHASSIQENRILLSNGFTLPCDICFLAVGIRPSSIFKDSEIPIGKDGGLLVNSFLQSPEHPEIFGGGDCISFQPCPLDKVGVYAVRENPILYHNLLAALEEGELKPFHPQKSYLLIFNLGNGRGIFWRKSQVREGRLWFWLKDYIDKRFMQKFQVL